MTASDHTWLLTVAAAALWPGAPNPAPPATQLPVRGPSPSPSFDSTSITSSSKGAAAVWAAETERESWASETNPTLSVPTVSSCATPVSSKEKGRGITAMKPMEKSHARTNHTARTGDEVMAGTESFISTVSACFRVEKKNPKEWEKRMHFTLQ